MGHPGPRCLNNSPPALVIAGPTSSGIRGRGADVDKGRGAGSAGRQRQRRGADVVWGGDRQTRGRQAGRAGPTGSRRGDDARRATGRSAGRDACGAEFLRGMPYATSCGPADVLRGVSSMPAEIPTGRGPNGERDQYGRGPTMSAARGRSRCRKTMNRATLRSPHLRIKYSFIMDYETSRERETIQSEGNDTFRSLTGGRGHDRTRRGSEGRTT